MGNGPTVRICRPEQVPEVSRLLGLAAADTHGRHTAECGGCHGQGDPDTCPYTRKQRQAGGAQSTATRDGTPLSPTTQEPARPGGSES